MPAWPVQIREDEVWDMVAFLRRLPALDVLEYRSLTRDQAIAEVNGPIRGCVRCHGPEGRGRDGIPRLDFQSADYLFESLRVFRDGRSASGMMQLATTGLDDATLRRLAEGFASGQSVPAHQSPATMPDLIAYGDPGRKIPPCAACHGIETPARAEFPRLAGQFPPYLRRQLLLFVGHAEERGGGQYRELMQEASHALDAVDIEHAVQWYGMEALQ